MYGPSIMSVRQNGFRNLAKLAFWSYSVQVKDRKAPSDLSWPRFCCLRCFFQKNLPKKFFFWKLSYFKYTNKKRKQFTKSDVRRSRNYICPLLKRHSEITHVQARITHVQPTTGSFTCEDGKKTCTQFFVKTSFDLIMPTSRSNENLQRGYQLNSSFSKRMFYVCFSPAFSGSRPRTPGS